jgi:hypothetical protein
VGIGGSIALIVVGAIFAFAVDAEVGWLDLSVAGWVLMIAGVVGLVLTLWLMRARRRVVTTEAPVDTEYRTVERRTSDVGPDVY